MPSGCFRTSKVAANHWVDMIAQTLPDLTRMRQAFPLAAFDPVVDPLLGHDPHGEVAIQLRHGWLHVGDVGGLGAVAPAVAARLVPCRSRAQRAFGPFPRAWPGRAVHPRAVALVADDEVEAAAVAMAPEEQLARRSDPHRHGRQPDGARLPRAVLHMGEEHR